MVNDADFRQILHSHPVYVLRAFIKQHNITGYSKMKKAEIVNIMMAHKSRFSHLRLYVRPKKARAPRAPRARKPGARRATRARQFKNKEELSDAITEIMNRRQPAQAPPRPPRPDAIGLANFGLARRR